MRRGRRLVLAALAGACALPGAGAAPAAAELPPIKHVFVLVLENKAYSESFGDSSPSPYLARTLTSQGALLRRYYGTTHLSWGNYIAMVSGQGANPVGQADCLFFVDFMPGTLGADGQAMGQGCVYPASVQSLPDQIELAGLDWRGYMQDMGNSPTEAKTCRHPAMGERDPTVNARPGDQYATRHNPFVYFHSIIDDKARCDAHDVPLDRLDADLRSVATTPNYAMVVPNLCDDAHDRTCVDGRQGGLAAADPFLRAWVPKILGSPAFQQDGLLIVTFDEAPAPPDSGPSDASGCPSPCQSPSGPNTPNPGGPIVGPGGGLVGAVALSPYIRPGTTTDRPYNHYGLLRSVEDLLGLGHLGYAGLFGQTAFGSDVYTGRPGTAAAPTTCSAGALPVARRGRLPRGSVIRSVRLRRRGRLHPRLELVFTRAARLAVRGRPRPRFRDLPTRRVGPRRVVGCRRYRVTLPYRHGTASITAAVARASERRTIRF